MSESVLYTLYSVKKCLTHPIKCLTVSLTLYIDKKPRALRRALPSGFLCSFGEEKSKEREGGKEDGSEHWR